MSILDKILNVKASNLNRLSAEDITRLEKLHTDFLAVAADHDIWEMIIRSKLEERFAGHYTWGSRRWNTEHLSPQIDVEGMDNAFAGKFFMPTDAFNELMGERKELVDCYRDAVVEHFTDTYELELRGYAQDEALNELIQKHRHYEPIVDWIFSKLPTGSLAEYAQFTILETFRSNLLDTTITLEKNRLNFAKFKPFGYGTAYSNKKTSDAFFKAIGLFDTGSLTPMYGTLPLESYPEHYEPYQMNGSKLQSIRFYKNGKGTMYFVDGAAANEFISFFSVKITG
jgi:hypothetical protein